MPAPVNLESLRRLLVAEHGLCVVSLARADGSVSTSVVNAGLLPHPVTGTTAAGFVVRGDAFKRRRLRVDRRVTVTVRSGWEWQAMEGPAELIGPLDEQPDTVDIPALLREVFRAAGGTHDDWAEYDRVMAEERRTAVLVTPARVYGVTRN